MLVDSIRSFQTTLPVQSALVVGSSLMELILYMPIPNQTRLRATKINFGSCKSTPSKERKVLDIENTAVKGDRIAELVMLILKILSWLPDMYIIKAFMRICFPGLMATLMICLIIWLGQHEWSAIHVGIMVTKLLPIHLN